MTTFNSAELCGNGRITMIVATSSHPIGGTQEDDIKTAYAIFSEFDNEKPDIKENVLTQMFDLLTFKVSGNKVFIMYQMKKDGDTNEV